MTNSEFRSLLEAAVRGNSDALAAIFELYMPLINRLSRYNGQLDEDCRQFILIHITLTTWEEVRDMAQGRGGFARTKWCGGLECELAMKEKAGVSSRCMPLKQSGTTGKCPVCGKECTTDIYWGVAY